MSEEENPLNSIVQYWENPYWGGEDGWYFHDETGDFEGYGPYKTKEEAKKRLKQVEYFKHKK